MALTFAVTAIVSLDTADDIAYHAVVISYEMMTMMILTLVLYTLKRTQFNNSDAIFGSILLVILWLSGVSSQY